MTLGAEAVLQKTGSSSHTCELGMLNVKLLKCVLMLQNKNKILGVLIKTWSCWRESKKKGNF